MHYAGLEMFNNSIGGYGNVALFELVSRLKGEEFLARVMSEHDI